MEAQRKLNFSGRGMPGLRGRWRGLVVPPRSQPLPVAAVQLQSTGSLLYTALWWPSGSVLFQTKGKRTIYCRDGWTGPAQRSLISGGERWWVGLGKLPGLSHRCQGLVRSPHASPCENSSKPGIFASFVPGLALWLPEAGGIVVARFCAPPSCTL